jgi:hypothetical protein
MPFTDAELKTWVDGLGLPDDKKGVLLATLGVPEVLSKVGESVMMRGEFSRKLDELRATEERLTNEFKARVADEEKKTTDFINSTTAWKTEKEKIANEAIQARARTEEALAEVQKQIKAVATEYGIPEDKLPKANVTVTPTPERKDTPLRDDDGKFVTKEYFEGVAASYVKLPALITKLDREYERLFGREAPIIDWEKVIESSRTNKRTLMQEWEVMFKIPEKRAEIQKQAHDAEISAAEKRGAESERSKIMASNPGLTTGVRTDDHHGSPILERAAAQAEATRKANEASGKTLTVVDEGRGVAGAVRAFREGRYKDGKVAA